MKTQIKNLQRHQSERWKREMVWQARVEYLWKVQDVCREKIKLYKAENDEFKVLFWEYQLTNCKEVEYLLKQKLEKSRKIWYKKQTKLIDMQFKELDKFFGRTKKAVSV